jgi:SAM-dependent methyltransferase
MVSLLSAQRDLYQGIWSLPSYGINSPGEKHVEMFCEMTGTQMRGSVLDAGCGSGKAAVALAAKGFDVTLCDLTPDGLIEAARDLPFYEACLWHNLKRAIGFKDWVFCCDVLEHVPQEFTMLTIARLLEVARRGVFLSIDFQPDDFGVWMGQPLHQTVQPFLWWKARLAEMGHLRECRDLIACGVFLVEPR